MQSSVRAKKSTRSRALPQKRKADARKGVARPKTSMARRRSKPRQRSRQASSPDYGWLWVPVVTFFVLLAGLAVFYVWEHIRIREISREIIQLQRAKQVLLDENARLRAQAEELSSYRRIYRIAKEHFGFVELKPRVVVVPNRQ